MTTDPTLGDLWASVSTSELIRRASADTVADSHAAARELRGRGLTRDGAPRDRACLAAHERAWQ